MSLSRKRQMKRIVKLARKTPKKLPAMPSTAEIASGTETETSCAPSWTFPAAPESPSQEGNSSESRRLSTVAGRSWRKSRTDSTSGTRSTSIRRRTATAVPRTVTVAASPRDILVFAITKRTGYSKTSARKMPTNTMRKVSPIARNATASPATARTASNVRAGRRSSTRRASRSLHGAKGYGGVRLDPPRPAPRGVDLMPLDADAPDPAGQPLSHVAAATRRC